MPHGNFKRKVTNNGAGVGRCPVVKASSVNPSEN